MVAAQRALPAAFIDYVIYIKLAELARFQQEVCGWEHREYFDLL